jgi:hypothetical protein
MTNKELLVEIKTKLEMLEKQFSNHLATHTKYTYFAFATLIGMITTFLLVLIKPY